MSHHICETVRPLLPDWASGTLPASEAAGVDAHLTACDECAAEVEVLELLQGSRPEPPEDLAGRIQGAVRAEGALPTGSPGPLRGGSGSPGGTPWWAPLHRPGLAAAAVLLLALGTAVIWPQVRGRSLPGLEAELETPLMVDIWAADDGMVAGAPVFEELSDEQLLMLLEELEG